MRLGGCVCGCRVGIGQWDVGSWIPRLPSLDHILTVPTDQAHACVANYVSLSGEWNWVMLKYLLPHDVLLHIAAILPPQQNQDDDFILWNVSSSG